MWKKHPELRDQFNNANFGAEDKAAFTKKAHELQGSELLKHIQDTVEQATTDTTMDRSRGELDFIEESDVMKFDEEKRKKILSNAPTKECDILSTLYGIPKYKHIAEETKMKKEERKITVKADSKRKADKPLSGEQKKVKVAKDKKEGEIVE